MKIIITKDYAFLLLWQIACLGFITYGLIHQDFIAAGFGELGLLVVFNKRNRVYE